MREKVRDRGRLEHILDAINGILADRELYTLEQVKNSTLYTIDPESLWDTIQEDIPELKPWIEKYLKEDLYE